jgi:hypothetical protein
VSHDTPALDATGGAIGDVSDVQVSNDVAREVAEAAAESLVNDTDRICRHAELSTSRALPKCAEKYVLAALHVQQMQTTMECGGLSAIYSSNHDGNKI